MRNIEEIRQLGELNRAGEFSAWLRCMGAGRGAPAAAARIAEQTKAPRKVLDLLEKASVGGMGYDSVLDQRPLGLAFVDALRTESAFVRLYADMLKAPFHSRVSVVTTAAPAGVVAPGAAIPVRSVTLSPTDLEPAKIAVMCVVSREFLQLAPQASESMLSSSLKGSAAVGLDAAFVAVAAAGVSGTAATTASTADIRGALTTVGAVGSERLWWVASVGAARRIATAIATGGARVYPDSSPVGGSLLGIPMVVSSAVPANEIMLIDASAFAAQLEAPEIDFSEHSDVEMFDNPTGHSLTPATGANKVSLFQTDSIGIRLTLRYAVARIRANSVFRITGVAW